MRPYYGTVDDETADGLLPWVLFGPMAIGLALSLWYYGSFGALERELSRSVDRIDFRGEQRKKPLPPRPWPFEGRAGRYIED